jgi:hypothetical protein
MRATHVKRALCLVAALTLVVVIEGSDSVTQGKVQTDAQPAAVLQNAPDVRAGNACGRQPRRATQSVAADRQTSYPMGYIASFGAFSLPEQPIPPPPPTPPPPPIDGHAMFLARKQTLPWCYCFYDGAMTFDYFATDDWYGVTGWLYSAQIHGAGVRHFLFGAETVGWCQGVAQRCLIVYDQWWCPVSVVSANYGEACEGYTPKRAATSSAMKKQAVMKEPALSASSPGLIPRTDSGFK